MAKQSLKARMAEKKKKLAEKGSGSSKMIFLKEGTLRARILPVGEDKDFIYDVDYIYLGKDIGGFVSPTTFGMDCPATQVYDKLKDSSDADDKDLAKAIRPKKKGIIFIAGYKDANGKEIDPEKTEKFVLLSNSLQQNIIDLFLEEDWGDSTNPRTGYDIKLIRTGTGQLDTEYSCLPAKNTPTPKQFAKKIYDLEELVKGLVPTHAEIQEKIEKYFGQTLEELMNGEAEPSKGIKKSSDASKASAPKAKKKKIGNRG